VRFEENEAHSVAYGLNLGQESVDRPGADDRHSNVGPDGFHPFVLRNTRIWNTRWAVRLDSPSVVADGLDIHASVYGFYRANFVHHAYDRVRITDTGIPEAFSRETASTGIAFPQSGQSGFAKVGACFTPAEETRLRSLLGPAFLELAPAEAERVVRGSYNTKGLVSGSPLPRIVEDPLLAANTGVTCGPLATSGFPSPLQPLDDLPPSTVITSVEWARAGRLLVRGTTADDGVVVRVTVNGRAAKAIAPNFAQWEVVLDRAGAGPVKVTASAEDAAGNVEATPHALVVAAAL
jgi:hypothetical protein